MGAVAATGKGSKKSAFFRPENRFYYMGVVGVMNLLLKNLNFMLYRFTLIMTSKT